LSKNDIKELKTRLLNGNIREQKAADRWLEMYHQKQRRDTGDSTDTQNGGENRDNATVDGGELGANRGRSYSEGKRDSRTKWVKTGTDGTNFPRYVEVTDVHQPLDSANVREFRTSSGELYGFEHNGELYVDQTKLSPNAYIHEYTHIWDKVVKKHNPKLWARGKQLMKTSSVKSRLNPKMSLWEEVVNSEQYGKKWIKQGIDPNSEQFEDLVASEVHARLSGLNGESLLR